MTATAVFTGRRRRPAPRAWRIAELVTAVLLLLGAFLLWGPIGLGNGPLSVEMAVTSGQVARGEGALAFIVPMYNSGHAVAIVDGVTLVGGTRYPGPRLLRLAVVSSGNCLDAWPVRTTRGGFVMIGCGGTSGASLLGGGIPYIHPVSAGYPAAAEVAAPVPGGCWVMTEVTVHYHVGIRHYTATDPYQMAVCARDAAGQVNAAMKAAEFAPG
jgi:hypothetical protein